MVLLAHFLDCEPQILILQGTFFCTLLVLEFNMIHVRQKSIKAWPYCILEALPSTSNQCFPWPVLHFSYLHRK
jgi:hypothetical protein